MRAILFGFIVGVSVQPCWRLSGWIGDRTWRKPMWRWLNAPARRSNG